MRVWCVANGGGVDGGTDLLAAASIVQEVFITFTHHQQQQPTGNHPAMKLLFFNLLAVIMATLAHVASVAALPAPPLLNDADESTVVVHNNGTSQRQLGSTNCPGTVNFAGKSKTIPEGDAYFMYTKTEVNCDSVAYHLEYHGIGSHKPGEDIDLTSDSVCCRWCRPIARRHLPSLL
eukprot:COSAG05_NODE_2572_length_2885_cov_2.493180_3_plen_177_part_00